ncbi:MAG: hypothetical protein E5Y63_22375 [Mesorhizobium sp.]|nr:MAG: hypothetical protein E5Y63_22375 [Mesorhizobium sp.]
MMKMGHIRQRSPSANPTRWPTASSQKTMAQTSGARKRYRAIFVPESCWVAARAIAAWLETGNEIAEIWCFDPGSMLLARSGTFPDRFFPGWDTASLIRHHGIPVRLCPRLKQWPEAVACVDETGADTLLTVMTHEIVPPSLLALFGNRAINVHPALLPHYKGPSPRAAMLLDGVADKFGGVTAHVLTPGIDEGAIIGQRHVPFGPAGGYARWDALQAQAAASIVRRDLMEFLDGAREAVPQDPGSGSYRRCRNDEFRISSALEVDQVKRLCRLFGPAGRLVWKPDRIGAATRTYFISGFEKILGRPTGMPPSVTAWHIDLDVADARLRLRRRRQLERWRSSLDAVSAILHASRATDVRNERYERRQRLDAATP